MGTAISLPILYRDCSNLEFSFPCYQPENACAECEIRYYATPSIFPQIVHEEIARRRSGSSPPETIPEER